MKGLGIGWSQLFDFFFSSYQKDFQLVHSSVENSCWLTLESSKHPLKKHQENLRDKNID